MGILAVGAGAGAGLEDYLARLLAEKQQAEVTRHNMASEDLQGRNLDLSSQYRRDSLQDRRDAQTDRTLAMRGIGDEVTPDQMARETAAGAPSSLYQKTAPTSVLKMSTFQDLPPEQRPTPPASTPEIPAQPSSILFKGTGMQRHQAEQDKLAQARIDKPTGGGGYNAEVKTVTFQGKPVDANYDPRTQRYTYKGQDITQDVGHYEKPPSPDRVLIQSGENYIPRADATSTIKSGGTVPLPSPAATRQRMNMADKVKSHIPETVDLLEEADKKGLLGPLMGRWNDLVTNRLGSSGNPDTDELTGQLAFNLSGLRTGFANVHGGARGGGSIQMAQMWKDIFDAKQMSKERLLGALKAEQKWLETYGTPTAGGANGGGGLPSVGDTFQGGKVLKVTPLQ